MATTLDPREQPTASTEPAARTTPIPPAARPDRRRLLPLLLVVVLAVAFLVNASPWLGARFGETHDGRNAAAWGLASHALRTEGPIDSKLGGVAPQQTYANHPPAIIVETAVAETVAGEHRLVTRSPAWIGSLVLLALLAVLLIDAGLSPLGASVGIVVAGSSPMFLLYGGMLDTPVTALPFAVAVVILVQRAVQGRPLPTWAYAVAGAAVAVAGWQSTALAAMAGGWLALTAIRRRELRGPAVALAAGAAVGLGATFLWIHWVYGSFLPFSGAAQYRASSATLADSLAKQFGALRELVPVAGIVGIAGLAMALVDRRLRPLAIVTLPPIVAYAIAFRGGADIHDYWNYAVVVPLALGSAIVAERATAALRARYGHVGAAIPATLALLGLLAALAVPSATQNGMEASLGTPALLDVAEQLAPADGPPVAFFAPGGADSPWITYESGRKGLALKTPAALERLGREQPDMPMLVVLHGGDPQVTALLEQDAVAVDGIWAIVRAGDVVAARAAAKPGS
jgi:hypothetical protein